jgi:suppressor of ftsI
MLDPIAASRLVRLLLSIIVVGLTVPALAADRPFVDPPMLSSREGRLVVHLDPAPGAFWIDGRRFDGMLYNGAYIPPIWRLRPGDTLTVTLHNRRQEMTNLHFHGLNVSARGNGDNIFVHVQPGTSFTYRVEIPVKRDVGLFWYHSHAHGRASPQIIGGLSGGLIVEGAAFRGA